MTRTDSDAIGLHHGYLNALYSYLQGYYSRLTVLASLTPSPDTEDLRGDVGLALEALGKEFKAFWGGAVVDLSSSQFEHEAPLLSSLYGAALYYYDTAPGRIAELIYTPASGLEDSDVHELVGHFADQVYSREHFIKGLIAYGDKFNLPEVSDRWRQQLLGCQNHIREANSYYVKLKEHRNTPQELLKNLKDECFLLPGILRCKAADLRRLHGHRIQRYDASIAGFEGEEFLQWQNLGFDPLSASYWAAFGFDAPEAQVWLKAGFHESGFAAGFWLRGIELLDAIAWIDKGVSAVAAASLASNGVDPQNYTAH